MSPQLTQPVWLGPSSQRLFPLKRWLAVVKTGLGSPSRVSGPCPATPVCRHDACTLFGNLSLKFRIFPPNGSAVEGLGVGPFPRPAFCLVAQCGRRASLACFAAGGVGSGGARGHWPMTQPPPRPACVLAPLPGLRPDLLRQVLLPVLHHPQVRHREGGARVRALLRAAEQVSPLPAARGPPCSPGLRVAARLARGQEGRPRQVGPAVGTCPFRFLVWK